jgi:hypothetical protein
VHYDDNSIEFFVKHALLPWVIAETPFCPYYSIRNEFAKGINIIDEMKSENKTVHFLVTQPNKTCT